MTAHHASRWVLALLTGLQWSCAARPVAQVARTAQVAPSTGAHPQRGHAFTCFGRGPLACDAPAVRGNPCGALDACWPDPAYGYAPSGQQRTCTVLATSADAPAGEAARRTVVMEAPLVNAKDPNFRGFYLLAEYDEGLCLLDELVSPSDAAAARCQRAFQLSWETEGAQPTMTVKHDATCTGPRSGSREVHWSTRYGVARGRFDLYWDLPKPPTPTQAAATAESFTCERRGPWSCDEPPAADDPASICAHISACVRNRFTAVGVLSAASDCEALTSVTPAPPSSGAVAVAFAAAAVRADPADDGPLQSQFMLAKYAGHGWCLIDQMFEPARVPQSADSANRVDFLTAAGSAAAELTTVSERIVHEAVDQDEQGYSGVVSEECARRAYELRAGGFRRLRREERSGRCSGEADQTTGR